jgi:hypothetical protein
MRRRMWLAGLILFFSCVTSARADTGVIVRTTNLSALQALCLLPTTCTVVGNLDGSLGQVFLVTTPLPLTNLLGLLNGVAGFVDAEVDQVLSLVGGLNVVPTPLDPTLMSDRSPVVYPAGSTTTAWNSYVNQPAASVVEVQTAQSDFHATGAGIVADIDTGVDPNHPVLKSVLLAGYDFTRNQPGGSEMNDLPSGFPAPSCTTTCSGPVQVNQSSAAILDQSSAAILDTGQTSAFGHGTMVMGIIHLAAPTAELLPLKAFKSDGTANLSDILRAIYYAVQQGNANVINMSFDTKTSSTELKNALDYANQLGLTCVASAGNDGAQETVYPAALQSDVMGVASVGSTSSTDGTRSSFSNFGDSIVWVAAPGEQIVTTYPFSSYAAGWGTSFSAPFVSGGGALLHALMSAITESESATAIANAAPLTETGMGHGRLDLVPALQSLSGGGGGGSPDYTVSASPPSQTIAAGQTATFTLSVAPANGFNQTVTWSCTGAPTGATCSVSPSTLTLDGTHTATATVTLTTTSRSMVSLPDLLRTSPVPLLWFAWALRLAGVVALAALLGFFGRKWSSELRPRLARTAALVALSLCAYSCGGGYTGGGGPGPPALYSMMLNPSTVNGGGTATGQVTLNQLAPNGGATISLSSSSAAATVPASVTVAAGQASATFTVSTGSVAASTPVTITGSYGGVSQTAMLTVMPVSSGGTPAGTYSLTLTGTSGNLSHSDTLQVVVN